MPATVVEDRPEQTVLWLPPATTYAMGDDLFGDWKLYEGIFESADGQLRLTRRDARFSLHLFRHADGSFRGWYVNLEQRQQRRPLGFDFEDELLDIWIEPDAAPNWLDEEELDDAVRRGVFSRERAAQIRANGKRVLADPPWPTGWEDWQTRPWSGALLFSDTRERLPKRKRSQPRSARWRGEESSRALPTSTPDVEKRAPLFDHLPRRCVPVLVARRVAERARRTTKALRLAPHIAAVSVRLRRDRGDVAARTESPQDFAGLLESRLAGN